MSQLIEGSLERLLHPGWQTLVLILLVICFSTRFITDIQSRSKDGNSAQPRAVKMIPYWIPWLGHSFSFLRNNVTFLEKSREYINEPVFGIKLGGITHNIIVSSSMAKSFLLFRGITFAPLINYTLRTIFGDQGDFQKLNADNHQVYHHNIPNLFMTEPFLTESSTTLARQVQQETPNLVTFARSPVDQMSWERGSQPTVIESRGKAVCEVNFFALIRNFVGQLTVDTIMGHTLLEVFPGLLSDIWSVDDQFLLLSMGIPHFLTPGLSAANLARGRLLGALAKLHEAFLIGEEGGDPGMEFRDLDDISEPIKRRIQMSKSLGLSPRASAPGHLSILWAMNGNAPNIVFYHLLRLYANRTLLEDVRKEIAPFVQASRPNKEETGFPIPEPPRISIDMKGLHGSCHLLKATVFETLRLDSAGLSFRELTSDLTVTETEEEAKLAGQPHPRSYQLKKGERVAISHGVLQGDARNFSNPSQFDPLRFLQMDPKTGKECARMEAMTPFGGGMPICKGRAFSERQIMVISAAIISVWDVQPATGGEFSLPEHKVSSAAYLPKRDIRVHMTERVQE